MLKLVYSLLTLPYSQSVELRPNDNINLMTFEDLQLEGPEGNKREVQTILKKLNKVDMVSNIADFDTKPSNLTMLSPRQRSSWRRRTPKRPKNFGKTSSS